MNSYTVELEEDEWGNLILPFPDEVLKSMGWREGDKLSWRDNGDGSFSITRAKLKDGNEKRT